jgi:hypothetical protein
VRDPDEKWSDARVTSFSISEGHAEHRFGMFSFLRTASERAEPGRWT